MSGRSWGLWVSQVAAILRLETGRNFLRKRAIPVCLLALMPVALFAAHVIAYAQGWSGCSGREDLTIYAGTFQLFTLRLAIFFGCAAIFMNLFRGEVVEKSLHYYFLAPVRREILVVGKYLSGLVTAIVLFGASTVISYLAVVNHLALTKSRELAGPAAANLWPYLGVTVLACIGYGSVFLILGLFFRNPVFPTAAVLVWESLIVFMPPLLKKFSVIYYLESLCPVRVPFDGPGKLFAITAEPTSVWIAAPGLLALTVLVLFFSSLRIRHMEISYGTE